MRNFLFKPVLGVAAAIYLSSSAPVAQAHTLTLGDPAPPIVVNSFVKGSAVTSAPLGKVSVVEFWATWCGPCKESIPHLTELAKKFPAVKFIGVSVFEQDQSLVKPFVAQMGAKMDYSVAMDKVAAGAKGQDGVMAKTWMEAAEQPGIPTAFIIGKDGKIAWIGHPMMMEEPLTKITEGDWDVAAAAAKMKADQEAQALAQAKMRKTQANLMAAMKTNDPNVLVVAIDKEIATDPTIEPMLASAKFNALRKAGNDSDAITYGEHLMATRYKASPEGLNELAWNLVDPKAKIKLTPPYAALALKAAKAADDLSAQKDPAIADTYAAALFANGDAAGAVAAEERAIRVSKGTAEETDPGLKISLATYRKAAGASATAKAQ